MALLVAAIGRYAVEHQRFINQALDPNRNEQRIKNLASQILQKVTIESGNTKRYKFQSPHQETLRDKALLHIFNQVFDQHPVEIIAAAQEAYPSLKRPYPLWNEVVYIQIPKVMSGIFNNLLVKLALTIVVVYNTGVVCHAVYNATGVVTRSWIPFIINHTPIQVVRFGNALFDLRYYFTQNFLEVVLWLYLAQYGIEMLSRRGIRIPLITYLSEQIMLRVIGDILFNLCFPKTFADFVGLQSCEALFLTWNTCHNFSKLLQTRVIEPAQAEKLAACKTRALDIWKTIMVEGVVESAVPH